MGVTGLLDEIRATLDTTRALVLEVEPDDRSRCYQLMDALGRQLKRERLVLHLRYIPNVTNPCGTTELAIWCERKPKKP